MDFWTNPAVLLVAVGLAIVFLVVKFRRRPAIDIKLAEERERIVADTAPKCVCGEVATDPAPVLKRGRGAWDYLRNLYGAPPRYTREVDLMKPHVLCRSHVHVADEMTAQFIFDVRAKYSALNVEIAQGAAGFEQEHLLAKVKDSLTAKQKRATMSNAPASPLRMVKTGTEDEG